jgi:hypothetical protein
MFAQSLTETDTMKSNTFSTRLSMVATLALLLALLLPALRRPTPARAASIIYVRAASTCTSSCGGSWANAYKYLQDALAAVTSGDQIWVAAGTYYPDEGALQTNNDPNSTFTLQNGVAIYGDFVGAESSLSERNIAANLTVLSGEIQQDSDSSNNAHRVATGGNVTTTAVLDGFTITVGYYGGGMYNNNSSPTLSNVTFSDNFATIGGGMYNDNSNPTLSNVTFSGNSASGMGGGMYNNNSSPTLSNVTFSRNGVAWFGYGGGMYNNNSSPTLSNVTFSDNTANILGSGGGMYNASGSAPTLTNVTFSGNAANLGGAGMYNDNSSPTLSNVTFFANDGNYSSSGGGMFNYYSNPTLSNVTFSGNTAIGAGGGMYNNNSNPTLTNVTFFGNSADFGGGGMYNDNSGPTLKNVIIGNSTRGGDCVNGSGGSISASSSNNLIEDSVNACGLTNGSNGNIIGSDPNLGLLQNNGGDTLTHALLFGSPAIDAGTNNSCPATDQRGVTRPQGAICDIGAYEHGFVHLFLPLILR